MIYETIFRSPDEVNRGNTRIMLQLGNVQRGTVGGFSWAGAAELVWVRDVRDDWVCAFRGWEPVLRLGVTLDE
ncbi:hypothetical protein AC233_10830 [Burkholderia sp. HB1]|nr:hypothetical protein AC233_10830 [Burkholderia sp. HB1]OWJ56150.1 hypothetical protein BWU74_31880 [Burkholderia sp. Bk]